MRIAVTVEGKDIKNIGHTAYSENGMLNIICDGSTYGIEGILLRSILSCINPEYKIVQEGDFHYGGCECGKEIEVSYNNLKSGNTKSCGCWHERHGEVGTRLYKCWQDMKSRCEYTGDWSYHNYGGRGIQVCDEWRNSYLAFRQWALDNGYTNALTIDRIDVNGNYEPSNCRWATIKEQQNNKRDNVYVEYNGERLTLREFAKKYTEPKGIGYKTLWHRFSVAKWDLDKCINTPLMNK